MHLQLRDGVFHCFCDSRAIFLDTQANRYFALPQKLEAAFREAVDDDLLGTVDHERVEALITEGILVRSRAPASVKWGNSIPPPIGDLPQDMDAKPSALLVFRAVCARLWARRLVGDNGIDGLRSALERLSKPDTKPQQESAGRQLAQLRSAFEVADKLISPRDQCLPRSLAMHRLAKVLLGTETRVLLGVRLAPFAAHCWVEFEQRVLTGDFEQARLFTPIMSIQ